MEVTLWELGWMLSLTPIAVFYFYWKGYNKGRREGYIAGRSLTRVPVRNDR